MLGLLLAMCGTTIASEDRGIDRMTTRRSTIAAPPARASTSGDGRATSLL